MHLVSWIYDNSTLCKLLRYSLLLVLLCKHFLTLSIYPVLGSILLLANYWVLEIKTLKAEFCWIDSVVQIPALNLQVLRLKLIVCEIRTLLCVDLPHPPSPSHMRYQTCEVNLKVNHSMASPEPPAFLSSWSSLRSVEGDERERRGVGPSVVLDHRHASVLYL